MNFIFGWALKFVTGGALSSVMDWLKTQANNAALEHKADTEAAAAILTAHVQAEIEARKAQVAVSSRHDKLVTFIGSAFAFHVWMIVLDSAFHLNWNVAALPAPMDGWEGQILLSFFIVAPTATVAKTLISKIWK